MQLKTYASFWQRLLAALLNSALLGVDFFILLYLLSAFWSHDLNSLMLSGLWILLYTLVIKSTLLIFLNALLVSELGGNLGKLVLGLRIEHEDGSKLTFKRAIFREHIAKIASNVLMGLGYFWIFKNQKRQAWHDMLADTYVLDKSGGMRVVFGTILLVVILAVDCVFLGLTAKNFSSNIVVQDELQNISASLRSMKNLPSTDPRPNVVTPTNAPSSRQPVLFDSNFILDK